jgi:hypothetical protein
MKYRFTTYYLAAIGGVLLLVSGILLIIFADIAVLPFVMLGIGAGGLTGSLGGIITARMAKKDHKFARDLHIEMTDERNVQIEIRAKSSTRDWMSGLSWLLLIFLAVMQVELWIILVLLGVNSMQLPLMLFFMGKYRKEM